MNIRPDTHSLDIPLLCQGCEVRQRGVCGALDPDQLLTLARDSTKHEVNPGVELIGDAEKITMFSNVLTGVVKLTKTLLDGRQQIVGLQFSPDFIGRPFRAESSLNAETVTNVSLCSFPRAVIERMIKESPKLEHRLLEQTLRELDEARDWMVTLGRKTATEKVASFLLLIVGQIDLVTSTQKPVAFDLPLTRADMADFLGLTIETVSRQLTKLRSEGVIQFENSRRIVIDDINRLERRASH